MRKALFIAVLAAATVQAAEVLIDPVTGYQVETRPDNSWWSPSERPRVVRVKDAKLDAKAKAAPSGKWTYSGQVKTPIVKTWLTQKGKLVTRTNGWVVVETVKVNLGKAKQAETANGFAVTNNATYWTPGRWVVSSGGVSVVASKLLDE